MTFSPLPSDFKTTLDIEMPFDLFLVNHTQKEYCYLCRSGFSQERAPVTLPAGWNGVEDELEVLTEYIFREKLKHRKQYTEVEMWPEPSGSEDEDSDEMDQSDFQEDIRGQVTQNEDEELENEELEDEVTPSVAPKAVSKVAPGSISKVAPKK